MIASMTLTDPGMVTEYVVSRSTDGGFTWSAPVAAAPSLGSFAHDKGWLACDTTAASAHYGNCYLAYADFALGRISIVRSTDG